MKADERRRLDRLLSGGPGPSVQEKETMLREILTRKTSVSLQGRLGLPVRWRWMWAPVSGAIAVAAVAAFVLLSLSSSERETGSDEFVVRGGLRAESSMRLACTRSGKPAPTPQKLPRCRPGDMLTFDLQAPTGLQHFSAAALGPGGLLVWYFPSETNTSLRIEANGVAQQGIVIGSEHAPGEYRAFGIFSKIPLGQDQLRAVIQAHSGGKPDRLGVIVARFTVVAP
jgi:hypothetical protein